MELNQHPKIYSALKALAAQEFKGFEIRYKDQSILMRALNMVVRVFNRRFMSDFITVIGNKVYFPTRDFEKRRGTWKTLAHEMVHMEDRKNSALFGWLYLFPQVLFPLCVVVHAALGSAWWYYLLSLVFLAPLPAPFRMRSEAKAYAMTMAIEYWMTGQVTAFHKNYILRNFSGPNYYYMWPFRAHAAKVLDEYMAQVISRRAFSRSSMAMFPKVFSVLKEHGVVVDAN